MKVDFFKGEGERGRTHMTKFGDELRGFGGFFGSKIGLNWEAIWGNRG